MGQEKKLPPLRFLPQRVERPWGSVEYDVADLGFIESVASGGWLGGNTLSELMETYLDRIVGDRAFDYFGTQFPVMVKTLDVKGRTSLHVNPDDETAAQRYDAFGKTALWHVLEAGKDARLYLGFKRDVSAEEFYRSCMDGTVEDLLHVIRPKAGENYLIRPGEVHAAQGVKLLEIAESSELWFRLHDWGSLEREIHLEEAFDLIELKAWKPMEKTPLFTVNQWQLDAPASVEGGPEDSFRLYSCTGGAAALKDGEGNRFPFKAGETLLVPAEMDAFSLEPCAEGTVLLETLYKTDGFSKD